ncbi:MAG: AI-2E family transporter [Eubacterium sp.]|nr:AI-2E family transporter [Eubacterium sp.]
MDTEEPEKNIENEKKPSKRRMRDNFRPEYTRISFYVILTVMILYFLIRFFDHVGNIFGAIGSGINWLGVITKPLILGLVFAYLLYPMVNFFERRLDMLRDRLSGRKFIGGEKIPDSSGAKKINTQEEKLHTQEERPGTQEVRQFTSEEASNKKIRRSFRRGKNKKRSTRGLAVAITCLIVALIIFVLLSLIVSTITSQLSVISMKSFDTITVGFVNNLNALAVNIESVLHKLNISSAQINDLVNQAGTAVSDSIEKIARNLIGNIKNLPSFFSMLLFAIIFGIYFMVDGEGLKKYWGHVFRTIAGKKGRKYLEEFASEADRVFSGYIRGQLIDALFMAVAVSITLSVIHVRYAIIIGVLTGIGNLIPYVGPFVAYGSTAIVCLLNWNLQRFIIAMVVLFILQTIDGNVVNPKLLGNSIRIHPVLVIVSLLIGEKVGGLLGMIIAVPCGGLLKVYFEKLIAYIAGRRKATAMKQEQEKTQAQAQSQAQTQSQTQAQAQAQTQAGSEKA